MSIKEAMIMEERMKEPFLKVLEKNAKELSDTERKNLVHKLTAALVEDMFPEAVTTGKVIIDAYEIEGGVITVPAESPLSYIFVRVTPGEDYDKSAKFACRGVPVNGHPDIRCIKAESKKEDTDYQLIRLSVPFEKRYLIKDVKLGAPDGSKIKLKDWLNIETFIIEDPDGSIPSVQAAWDKHLSAAKKKKEKK